MEDVEFEQRRRQGEGEEQVVYCAVGKEWKANLLWVLANLPRAKRLVFLHLHRPASRINMMGAWVPVSQLAEQEVTAYRQLEEGKIGKVLDDLLDICKSQKVNASKTIIASDDTARGLVQFVDDHGVTELVMGAASDRAYHRKMRAPRSKKALMVQRRANPCCKIWFVCKGNLICTREGSEGAESWTSTSDYSRSKSSPRLPCETTQEWKEDSSGGATEGSSNKACRPSEEQQQLLRREEGWDEKAVTDAENLKREAYEESRRRQMAERELAEAKRAAEEAERWHQSEARRRKEVEEMLGRERAEMERDRQELDAMLEQMDKANARSAEMEVQIASSERAMGDLEARLHESYAILHSLREDPSSVAREEEEEEGGLLSLWEVEEATNHFDESVRIDNGGGRSKVYRGRLNGMDVAVKVLNMSEEEAPRLLQRQHPQLLVQVVGVCPPARAVVYELLPGARSLDEHHLLPTLPWHVRCGVAHRTCQALALLHAQGSVHGHVSPANILVQQQDGCWTSKLRLPPERRRSSSSLTVAYASPRYLATGDLTPRCDLYSIGVLLLQLVTGKPAFLAPKAALQAVNGAKEWHDVVDPAACWPVRRAREVLLLALKCCDDDDAQLLQPQSLLQEAMTVLQDAIISDGDGAPSYFLCPILKELMRDPHIAADGFSYEAQAIREWIRTGHDTSPMTNLKLPTRNLTPNHALRSAIQQWRQPHLDHY